MQERYTYSTQRRQALMLYVDPGFTPPDSITLENDDGLPVDFIRISDLSLECDEIRPQLDTKGKPYGGGPCRSYDCHRAQLGKCQCGRHPQPTYKRA